MVVVMGKKAVVCVFAWACVASGFHHEAAARPGIHHQVAAAGLSAALLGLAAAPAVASSSMAAQVSLNSLPPSSIEVKIQDLPVVGPLVSGTYTKVADGSVKGASVTIASPKDKLGAIKAVATEGHLEFDVAGFVTTHLDVDVAADEPGVAKIRVASPLIPKLPFKNGASSAVAKTGRPSAWKKVTDLGSGDVYYFNEKTGVTQFDAPTKL
mmetsp:Transcript_10088/g.25647  ORF Transcript_10088/g.25647 Transcript_10088/m.25647 type:complete len:211 (+) Transcript_10088:35-667(+)